MPHERHLQKTILRELRRLAAQDPRLLFRKRHGSVMGAAGDPDIYGLYHGIHFEIELKNPDENPTPLQALRLQEWERAGASAAVVRSTQNLRHLLAKLKLRSGPSN